MLRKVGEYIFGIVLIALMLWGIKQLICYIVRKRSRAPQAEPKKGLLPAPMGQKHLHDADTYNKLVSEAPQKARKWFMQFYANAQRSKLVLDTSDQRREFEEWLREQVKEALATENYRKNLYYWLNGIVETPEASIVLRFIEYLTKKDNDFTREVLERLANEFNHDLRGNPNLYKFPSELDKVVEIGTTQKQIQTAF